MKKEFCSLVLAFLFFCVVSAHAEAPWNVNGHMFSNLECIKDGSAITINGKVSGGKIRGNLTAQVAIVDNAGNMRNATVVIENYDGSARTFSAKTWGSKTALWWEVVDINANGDISQAYLKREPSAGAPEASQYTSSGESYKVLSGEKTKGANERSVLFTSRIPVNIVIRDRKTQKVVLIKDVGPGNTEETTLKVGDYSLKILGDNVLRERNIRVTGEERQVIDL